jgi:hypothetical protein
MGRGIIALDQPALDSPEGGTHMSCRNVDSYITVLTLR